MSSKNKIEFLVPYLVKPQDYEFIQYIGSGSFGSVEKVKEVKTGKFYAKKNIPFQKDDIDAGKYFFREFLSLKDFRVEGLPFLHLKGFNFKTEISDPFIITEYIEGDNLRLLIDHNYKQCKDVPTSQMKIIYGTAFALKILHGFHYVHRDLKPENILIKNVDEPVLADFGFARQICSVEEQILMTRKLGTLIYMAPEQLEDNDEEPDYSLDVYSFAVMVFQIICKKLTFANGKNPYKRENEQKLKNHILSGKRYDMPNDEEILPDNFKNFITDCWDSNTRIRWTMTETVERIESGELILPGCNMEVLNEYINRLNSIYKKSPLFKIIKSLENEGNEDKEEEDDVEEDVEDTEDFPF